MSIRSTNPTDYISNNTDSPNRIIHELRNIDRTLQGASGGIPVSTTITGSPNVTVINGSGNPVPVTLPPGAFPLPVGASTEATLSALNDKVSSNQFLYYKGLAKNNGQEVYIKYTLDTNHSSIISVEIFDKNYVVLSTNPEDYLISDDLAGFFQKQPDATDTLANQNDVVSFSDLPVIYSSGVIRMRTSGQESARVDIISEDLNGNIIGIPYERSVNADVINGLVEITLSFNLQQTATLRVVLAENATNSYNRIYLMLSTTDKSVINNIVRSEEPQIDVADFSNRYSDHPFLNKNYSFNQITKSLLAFVGGAGDTNIVTELLNIGAGIASNGANTTITTGATSYVESVPNKTTAQLAAGATFTGSIVSVLSYPQAIISVNSDQPFTLTIEQFSDLAGAIQLPSIVYTRLAGEDFNQPVTLSGSYMRVKLQNTGAAATTNLFLETWFGTISATPNLTNAGSLPVDIKTQSDYIIGQANQTAVINNILSPTASANATDAGGYNSGTTTIVSTGTGGTFIFEGSNNNITFEPLTVKRTTLTDGAIIVSAITATNSTLTYEYAVKYKYIRLRIATAITGGIIQAFSRLSSNVFTTDITRIANSVAGNVQMSATQQGTWIINDAANTLVTDVASSAITTTTTTAAVTPSFGTAYQVNVPVTAVSGTNPTLQITIEESSDNGTNWFNVYRFPAITTTGSYFSPVLPLVGNRVRYVQTITGTTPSFTRTINRLQSNQSAQSTYVGQAVSVTSTVTVGGTAQTAIPANTARKSFEIQNLSNADLYICIGGTASATNGFLLASGAMYSEPSGYTSSVAISVFGATTGQRYTYIER